MEWKKILVNRRLIGLIIVLFIVQMMVFGEKCRKNDHLWLEKYNQTYEAHLQEEQQQYIDTFYESINEIMEQAESLNEISIFTSEDSFSKRNLELTKEAFQPLLNVELTYVKGRTLTEFFSFKFGNLCALLCGVAIAFELSEVRKKNIRCITFTTEYGKLRLAFEKAGALFLWAFVITLLFEISIMQEGILLFHENPLQILSSPAQNFVIFSYFPLKLTVWQTLTLYLLLRTVILYVIMMLAWSVAAFFDHVVLAVGICGVFTAVEYFLYVKIDDNNVWKLLKYCNIWYQTAESSYFTNYFNLNILEYAVSRNTVIMVALIMAYLLSLTTGVYICCRRYPYSSKVNRLYKAVSTIEVKIENIRGPFLEKLSLTGMELYKVLIVQKGIIAILLLGMLLFYKADFTQIQRSTQQKLYYEFVDNYQGEPGEESYNAIAQLSDKLEYVDETFNQKLSDQELDTDTKIELSLWYDSFSEERLFLDQIREQTEALETIFQESGIAVWYVNLYSFDHLLQCDDAMLNLGLAFVILWICIGMYIGENGSGMARIINSSYRESLLYKSKIRIAVILASLIYFIVLLYELISIAMVYGLKGVRAPVQSILDLSDFGVNCKIWQYFLARYVIKYIFILLICVMVCKALETIVCKKGLINGVKNRKSV